MTGSGQLTVADLGEFQLIERLIASLPVELVQAAAVRTEVGDDAAVWTPTPGKDCVITTDTLVEDVHFRLGKPDGADWRSLGHKMLAVNLSDIAAMGADPVIATVTLGLTGSERIEDLVSLYQGMIDLALRHGVVIAGGDIVRSPHAVTLGVTVVGEVAPGEVLTRQGASPGDLIAVSGTLGASAAGLALLDASSARRSAKSAALLIGAHLRPIPRIELGRLLARNGATSGMDLSDGLLGDLPKVLDASGVSAEIDEERVPILPAVRALFPDRFRRFGLSGGEDYELLFTVAPDHWKRLQREAHDIGSTITVVGRVVPVSGTRPNVVLVSVDGSRRVDDAGAFNHFR